MSAFKAPPPPFAGAARPSDPTSATHHRLQADMTSRMRSLIHSGDRVCGCAESVCD
jgi:hypothetical protein